VAGASISATVAVRETVSAVAGTTITDRRTCGTLWGIEPRCAVHVAGPVLSAPVTISAVNVSCARAVARVTGAGIGAAVAVRETVPAIADIVLTDRGSRRALRGARSLQATDVAAIVCAAPVAEFGVAVAG